ncbi:hypothetical protein JCM11251_003145 [Rhodosporidiobolus azoricus]
MASLDKAIEATPRGPSSSSPSTYVYSVFLSPSWNVLYVPHGGYLLSIITSAALKHQATHAPPFAPHKDPAHLSSQFLTPSVAGKAEVEIQAVSVTKNWTRLNVELWQWTPKPDDNNLSNPEAKRVLRISAHFLLTTLPPSPSPGPITAASLGSAAANVNYLDMPCPLLEHPASIDMSDGGTPVGPKLQLMPGIKWKEVKIEKRSDGALAWGGWMELNNGEDLRRSAALIGFFADVAKTGAEMLFPDGSLPLQDRFGPFWFPTMTLSLDFKAAFPLLTSSSSAASGPASRTFGIYSSTKVVRDGRHDLTVEVWSAPANLGERAQEKASEYEQSEDGVERWRREGSRLLAVGTQMALCVPIAVNLAKNGDKKKEAKL